MPECHHLSRSFGLIGFSLYLLAIVDAGAAPDDFDQLEITGKQLLVNGSFEAMVRGHDTPEGWGVYKTVEATFRLVSDAQKSHHGVRCVRFSPPDRRSLYGSLRHVPTGRHRVTAWVQGNGRIAFTVGAMRDDHKSLPPGEKAFAARLSSPPSEIASSDWHRVVWEFELPAEFRDQAGKPLNVNPRFSIQIEGDVMFDACSVAPVPAAPLKTVAAPDPRASTAAAKQPATGPPSPARIVIPKLPHAPAVDGKISTDEWSGAVALTGFTILNDCVLSERQAVVYLGYTDSHVYAAFSCPLTGQVKKQDMARDTMGGNETHGVELWLVPPDQGYYQFLTCPGPGKMDTRSTEGKAWNGKWKIQDGVVDIPEEIGGILSFRKKLWTTELAIPFATLGVTDPEAGVWRLNVTRNWAAPAGQKRASNDWTTWSQLVGRFAQPDAFAFATFAPAPAIQFEHLGDLANGELRITGNCRPLTGSVRLTAKAVLPQSGKTLSLTSVEIAAGAPAEFDLNSILQTNETQVLDYHLLAEDVGTGNLLYKQTIPFLAAAALRLRAVPVLYRDELVVEIDTSRVPDLPDSFTLTSRLLRGDQPASPPQAHPWTRVGAPDDIRHSLANLVPGEYGVKVTVAVPGAGKPLTGAVARFIIPEPQPWYNSKLGMTDRVPTPWHPVEVDGRSVSVSEREYHLGDVGLPHQAVALGAELFVAPPSLRAVVAGEELSWRGATIEVESRTDRAITWKLGAKAADLELDGTLQIEFDGFALWQVQISAPAGTQMDNLSLDFPFHRERALYLRATNPRRSDRGALVATLNGTGPSEPLPIAGVRYSGNGWLWPDEWCSDYWVGDDARGFAVLTETDAPLIGVRRSDVLHTADANTLRIYLVDGPAEFGGTHTYTYMWQATPVKPKPQNARLWHASYARNSLLKWLEEYKPDPCPVDVILDMWCLEDEGWPELRWPMKSFIKRNKPLYDAAVRVVPYSGTNISTVERPGPQAHLASWETTPSVAAGNPCGRWAICCPNNPNYRDFKVWCLERMITDLPLQGLYLDVSSATACQNRHHGCGWQDNTGEWHQTVPILANRRLYQRLYAVNKHDSRDCVLFRHGMPRAPMAGYVDVVTQGEDWCREGTMQYDRLTPEIFRAKVMRTQYGTPFTWYCFHHYWRGVRHGGRVPLATMLAYCLPHNTTLTDGHPGMWKTWAAIDPFWTRSEFLPYWSTQCPISTQVNNVLGTVYLKRDDRQALLIIANWNRDPRDVQVQIDFSALGIDPTVARLTRALEHPILGPDDKPEGDTMPNTPLTLRDNALPLSIHGRNLEVVLITQP